MPEPRLFLTSISSDPSSENPVEMIEPILPYLDGIVWCLSDVPTTAPSARYLETVKGAGKIIHRFWPTRHNHAMNDTLYTGLIKEGDFFIYTDDKERPAAEFLSRVKSEFIPMMNESDCDVIFYFQKAFLIRYRETLEYRNTPHWSLVGWNNRGIEWSNIEPNERLVRLNVRPQKRKDPLNWVNHYFFYYINQPAGSNTVALGLDQFPPGDRNQQFAERETRRLEFRKMMVRRGLPLNLDGAKTLLSGDVDEEVLQYVKAEKILSDFFWLLRGRGAELRDSHRPSEALPIVTGS